MSVSRSLASDQWFQGFQGLDVFMDIYMVFLAILFWYDILVSIIRRTYFLDVRIFYIVRIFLYEILVTD